MGPTGPQGPAGEVPEEWRTEVLNEYTTINNRYETLNKWSRDLKEAAAAAASMQVNLPQDKDSRMTFTMASVDGQTGVGAGYAYMFESESNTALTVSVGMSGSETALRAGVGFEFGDARKASYVQEVDTLLAKYDQRLAAVTEKLRRTEEDRQAKIREIERMTAMAATAREVCKEQKDRMSAACYGAK